jgi:hypothetical protein
MHFKKILFKEKKRNKLQKALFVTRIILSFKHFISAVFYGHE